MYEGAPNLVDPIIDDLIRDRSSYEHGMTGGMSFLLGEIERLACEGEPEKFQDTVVRLSRFESASLETALGTVIEVGWTQLLG